MDSLSEPFDRRLLLKAVGVGATLAASAGHASTSNSEAPLNRGLFPFLKKCVYLDSAHRAAAGQHLCYSSKKWIDDQFLTGGSFEYTDTALDQARLVISSCLGANPSDVAFIRSCIRGVNAAFNALRLAPGSTVIMPENEYIGLEHLAANLQTQGILVRRIQTEPDGLIKTTRLRDALASKPNAMIFSWVNNSTGAKLDVDEIGALCRSSGVFTICDAMQALGFQDRALSSLPVDVISSGAHKGLLGVPGVGFLWVNPASAGRLTPTEAGKESFSELGSTFKPDAQKFEYGNQNHIGIAISKAACRLLSAAGLNKIHEHIDALAAELSSELRAQGWKVITPLNKEDRGHIVTIEAGTNARSLGAILNKENFRFTRQSSRVRFSIGGYTSGDEIAKVYRALSNLKAFV